MARGQAIRYSFRVRADDGMLERISNLPPWLSLLCMVIYIKEEPTMRISVSSILTVFHDGQFWVGLAERVEDGRYGVARIVDIDRYLQQASYRSGVGSI